MNTTIKTIAIALGLSFAAQAQQDEYLPELKKDGFDGKTTILPKESKMRILVTNLEKQNLSLKLFDDQKREVYSGSIGKKQLQAHVIFNMEELPKGVYTFEVSNKTFKAFRKGENLKINYPIETLVIEN